MARRLDISLVISTLALAVLAALAATIEAEAPEGWFHAGSLPKSYESGVDSEVSRTGKSSAYLKSIEEDIPGFGTLLQTFRPDDYRGQRIRLSGYMKSAEVASWAGFWMRIDGSEPTRSLAFDNMQGRAVKGTTDWQKYEIVLDVAQEAMAITFGFLLDGEGQIWVDGLDLEIVGDDVPVTDMLTGAQSRKPTNLDFENRE